MIGCRCKRSDVFSRAVLIARELYVNRSGYIRDDTERARALLQSVLLPDHVKTYEETHGDYSAEVHLFPFRTEKLSPAAPMILHQVVGK